MRRLILLLVIIAIAVCFVYAKYRSGFGFRKLAQLLPTGNSETPIASTTPASSETAAPAPQVVEDTSLHSPALPAPSASPGSTSRPVPVQSATPPQPAAGIIPVLPPQSTRTPTSSNGRISLYSTVEEAQRAAVKRYPALAAANSAFSREYLARYNRYKQERPTYFQDTLWPLALADEIANKFSPAPADTATVSSGETSPPPAAALPRVTIHHFADDIAAAKTAGGIGLGPGDAFTLSKLEEAKAKAKQEKKPLGFVMTWGQFFGVRTSNRYQGSRAAFIHFYQAFHNNLVLVFVRHETELQAVPDAVKKGFFGPDEGGAAPNMAVTDADATELIVEIPMGGKGKSYGLERDAIFSAGAEKIDQWLAVHPDATTNR